MFTINDGWGSSDAQDVLASKLFTKPPIRKDKKKKGKKNNKNITEEEILNEDTKQIEKNENINTKEKQKKKKKRKIENDTDDIKEDADNIADRNKEASLPKKKKNAKTENSTTTITRKATTTTAEPSPSHINATGQNSRKRNKYDIGGGASGCDERRLDCPIS